jgi:hypothetical protein
MYLGNPLDSMGMFILHTHELCYLFGDIRASDRAQVQGDFSADDLGGVGGTTGEPTGAAI